MNRKGKKNRGLKRLEWRTGAREWSAGEKKLIEDGRSREQIVSW